MLDASNYFRGLLLLIRKDRKVTQTEIELMKRIGKTLGFEKEFCDTAIRDILENDYIADTPPDFSSKELALKFVKDGLSLAFSDSEGHPSEEQWLQSTAEINGLGVKLFSRDRENAAKRKTIPARLEADDLIVNHF